MFVFGTDMHLVTFIVVIIEAIMLIYQLFYYLFRPNDKRRLWYLILLFLLIFYNVTSALFPDPKLQLSLITQNILAYGSGFITASYMPFYLYKAFDLRKLKFHAYYGVPLFFIAPFLVFFVVTYSLNKNIELTTQYGFVIPFFYSIVLITGITRAVRSKLKEENDKTHFVEIAAIYGAIVPWSVLIVIVYFHVNQLFELALTNGGFIILTVIFMAHNISDARKEYDDLLDCRANEKSAMEAFEFNCQLHNLSDREIDVAKLMVQGLRYKSIAEKLNISDRTVSTHVQNIYLKTKVSNKIELIKKLG
ncbi:MAG: hypothetical protein JWQ25_1012 [Daejeonella sp.]|nr:hypothetical protein [Daejeonella sp.]